MNDKDPREKRARSRALKRLTHCFPLAFYELLDEERAKEGLGNRERRNA